MLCPLTFRIRYHYDSGSGINLPVSLRAGTKSITVLAKVDTGADYCVFERGVAESLAIDVERAASTIFSTAAGQFRAYRHELALDVLGLEMNAVVYFYEDTHNTRNVLGRNGWLNRIRLGIVDHDSLVYLGAYDD